MGIIASLYTIIKTKWPICFNCGQNQCLSTGVKKSYFCHPFHLTPEKVCRWVGEKWLISVCPFFQRSKWTQSLTKCKLSKFLSKSVILDKLFFIEGGAAPPPPYGLLLAPMGSWRHLSLPSFFFFEFAKNSFYTLCLFYPLLGGGSDKNVDESTFLLTLSLLLSFLFLMLIVKSKHSINQMVCKNYAFHFITGERISSVFLDPKNLLTPIVLHILGT